MNFADMTPEQRREIASKGGRAVHRLGRARGSFVEGSKHTKEAGRKGGRSRSAKKLAAAKTRRRGERR